MTAAQETLMDAYGLMWLGEKKKCSVIKKQSFNAVLREKKNG